MVETDALLTLYESAIAGADPGAATARAVESLNIGRDRRILLFAFGKAAAGMADATVTTLLKSLHQIVGGVMVTPEGDRSPYPTVQSVRGDHPIPGTASRLAAEKIAEVSAGRRGTDVVIVLVSGGTSSLIAAPLRGQKDEDLIGLYSLLLGAGLDIREMNAVRKRFSRWGGGRLALALSPAATHCFAVSDVPGDELAVIGSGPCTPDETTAAEVASILDRVGLTARISRSLRDHLAGVTRGVAAETPKAGHPAFAHVTSRVVVTNRVAIEAAAAAADEMGMRVEIVESPLTGAAADAGEVVARKLLSARATRNGAPKCLIWGGETTVVSAGTAAGVAGGGRCQELALAAAKILGEAGQRAAGIRILAAGTDGRDGQTDAAGACVDHQTWAGIKTAGGDPASALQRHESTAALALAGALIPRRATGTNVMDVVVGIVGYDVRLVMTA